MDTFLNLQDAVQSDLNIGDESVYISPTVVNSAINRAYNKIGGLFVWPELEDAKKTSTVANQEYYDYPDNWRPDSIWMLTVDGERFGLDPDGSPMNFRDYLVFKEDNPTSDLKRWSSQWRRFFIWPVPTTSGNNNINVWGVKVVDPLVDNTDVTIFSYSMREVNEAIVLEASAILKAKAEESKSAEFKSLEAKQIVIVAYSKIKKDLAKYEKVQPMFYVPDYFSNEQTVEDTEIGNF